MDIEKAAECTGADSLSLAELGLLAWPVKEVQRSLQASLLAEASLESPEPAVRKYGRAPLKPVCSHFQIFSSGSAFWLPIQVQVLSLTDRPDSRRPLNWERNQFELMMMEGKDLRCFWTDVPLNPRNYDVDHIVPITTYPINELWNLVPSESEFNRHLKRDRMPDLSWQPVMRQRLPYIYELYSANPHLHQTLIRGVRHRFPQAIESAQDLSEVAIELIFAVAESRNTPTFSTTL